MRVERGLRELSGEDAPGARFMSGLCSHGMCPGTSRAAAVSAGRVTALRGYYLAEGEG